MLRMQLGKEFRGVFYVLFRVEHFGNTSEILSVIMMVDLHAAEVDQDCAPA